MAGKDCGKRETRAGGGDQVVSGEGDEPTEQEVKDRLEDKLNQQLKV